MPLKFPKTLAHTFLVEIRNIPLVRAALFFQPPVVHAPLQAHLYLLRVAETGPFPHFGDSPEAVVHYASRCRAFAAERHQHHPPEVGNFSTFPFSSLH